MGGFNSGRPGGNPDITKVSVATRFKPGNPGARPGHASVSQRRLRKMMKEALPSVAAVQLLGADIAALPRQSSKTRH
jgi:hypothetical protein